MKAQGGGGAPAEIMREACVALLEKIEGARLGQACFALDDPRRVDWSYLPGARIGLKVKDMRPGERESLWQLVRATLSESGAATASSIMEHEAILGELERESGRDGAERDPGLYYLSVFGDPKDAVEWAWRLEGHHLSLQFSVGSGKVVGLTPSFFGANPARVPSGPRRGERILAPLEDKARKIVKMLDGKRRSRAVISDTAPRDIITGTDRAIGNLRPEGIAASSLSSVERSLLMDLLEAYIARLRPALAKQASQRLQDRALDKLHFAWAGGIEPGEPHYYRLSGGPFLIEYDNVQNGANHIHTVWRDAQEDFGGDVLRAHHLRDHRSST
jgi:hypothetical protein